MALVDREGKVREARVAKSSGSNVGFDEAAVEAAYKCVYNRRSRMAGRWRSGSPTRWISS